MLASVARAAICPPPTLLVAEAPSHATDNASPDFEVV
jgi:hypothetical protein